MHRRFALVLTWSAALAGCQLVSGLDELGVGTGGFGGAGGATTATGTSTGTMMGPTTTGGMCPGPFTPAGCDAGCPQSCAGELCVTTCPADPACSGTGPIACASGPATYDCEFRCSGDGMGTAPEPCLMRTIECPDEGKCDVFCEGEAACAKTTIQCKSGPCTVHCSTMGCAMDTHLVCGTGACNVVCSSSGAPGDIQGSGCGLSKTACPP